MKTPPIKTLGVAGLSKIAMDLENHQSDEERNEGLKHKLEVLNQKSVAEKVCLKIASWLLKLAGVFLEGTDALAKERELMKEEAVLEMQPKEEK